MADDRTYIKVHDGMPEHPKVEALDDDAAAWLLLAAWAYCSRHTTDGHIPTVKAHRLTKGASPARCRKLLAAGLLHDGPSDCCPDPLAGHYYCHDYLRHQRSAEQIEAMREQRRSAGRSGGLAKGKRVAKQVAKQTASKPQAVLEGTSNEVPQTEADTSGGGGEPPPAAVGDVEPNPAAVVAAYVEGATETGRPRPSGRLIGRVGRDARRLLAEGRSAADLTAAARRMGAAGWDDLDRELQRPQRGKPVSSGKVSATPEEYADIAPWAARGVRSAS